MLFVAVLLGLSAGEARAQDPDPVADAKGFRQNHDYFTQEPFEHIDTYTGSLVLTFVDLVLPGNAGRDLRFTRTYIGRRTTTTRCSSWRAWTPGASPRWPA